MECNERIVTDMTAQMHPTLTPAQSAPDPANRIKTEPILAAAAIALLVFAAAVVLVHSLAPQVCAAMALSAAGGVVLKTVAYLFSAVIAFAAGTELYWKTPDED